MRIQCPNGYKDAMAVGEITLTLSEVIVCGSICDSADLCKIEKCEFYDVTREGTRGFMKASAEEETIEGFDMKLIQEACSGSSLTALRQNVQLYVCD